MCRVELLDRGLGTVHRSYSCRLLAAIDETSHASGTRPCETATHADSGRADDASSESRWCRCAPSRLKPWRPEGAAVRTCDGEAKAGWSTSRPLRLGPKDVQDQVRMGPPRLARLVRSSSTLGPRLRLRLIRRDKWGSHPPATARRRVLREEPTLLLVYVRGWLQP